MLFRASLIVAFACVAACGGMPEDIGSTMPGPVLQTDADVPAPAATGGATGHVDALPPAPAPQGTGGAQTGTGGQGGQMAPDAMPAGTGGARDTPAADGGTPTPTKYLGCFDPDKLASETMCARPNPKEASGYDWQRKDGHRCALCRWKRPTSSVLDQRSGCTLAVEVNPQFQGDNTDPTPVLCVMTCGECAY